MISKKFFGRVSRPAGVPQRRSSGYHWESIQTRWGSAEEIIRIS
jgi:hypothetical protein